MKSCRTCAKTLPLSDYHPRKGAPGGVRNQCKECRRSEARQYHGRSDVRARRQSPGARERDRESCRRWYSDNRDYRIKKMREYKADNPETVRRNLAARRARLAAVPSEWISIDDMRTRDGDACTLCLQTINFDLKHPDPGSPSREHLLPLSEGGHDTPDNLAISHLRCNLRRGTKDLAEFRAFLADELKEQQ